jgi:hypothetical protein
MLFAIAPKALAQDEAPEQTEYKVGDRVEVDPQALALTYRFKKWQKATVTKVGPSGGGVFGYYVRIDAVGDSGPRDNYVMTGSNMIRPLQEAEKEAANTDAARPVTKARAKKADPEKDQPPVAGACQASDDTSGTTQIDIFKHLVQDRYVHKPDGEQDFTATVTFQTFKLGATHKWRPGVGGESPDGPGGRAGTTIYPVKAVYTVCADHPGYAPTGYRGTIEKRQDDNNFYCFKNQFGDWQCNLGEGTMGKIISTNK